jgi:hypothetical protein
MLLSIYKGRQQTRPNAIAHVIIHLPRTIVFLIKLNAYLIFLIIQKLGLRFSTGRIDWLTLPVGGIVLMASSLCMLHVIPLFISVSF